MANVDPSLVQKILHIAERKRKSKVHHHRQADDLRAGSEVSKRAAFGHGRTLGDCLAPLKRIPSDKTGQSNLLGINKKIEVRYGGDVPLRRLQRGIVRRHIIWGIRAA